MNSFRVVLSLAIVFIISIVANSATGYMFFYKHINLLLLIFGVGLVLFVLAVITVKKIKSGASV